jgi:hypothetical protein
MAPRLSKTDHQLVLFLLITIPQNGLSIEGDVSAKTEVPGLIMDITYFTKVQRSGVRKVQVTWLAELGLANSFIRYFAC